MGRGKTRLIYSRYKINDMKLEHLINNTYQVLDSNDAVLFQGSEDECKTYMLRSFLDKITSTPELLDVFKRLADK